MGKFIIRFVKIEVVGGFVFRRNCFFRLDLLLRFVVFVGVV